MTATRDAFERHMAHEYAGDLDAILADYAPDAIVVGPLGIGTGTAHIRASYEPLMPVVGGVELTSVQEDGDVIYVTFRAPTPDGGELHGTDTFVIRDSLIAIHTFYAHPADATH